MRTSLPLILCLILSSTATTMAHAEEQKAGEAQAEEAKKDPAKETKWYDRLTWSGNFRLRYEHFDWEGHFNEGTRNRFRYRLRFGFESQLFESLTLGVQLRSGNPQNPISDNRSFDDSFTKGPISLGEAWLDWRPTDWFSAVGGKFAATELWSAADIEWDDDVATEGAMEMFTWKPGGAVKDVQLNFYQFVLNEASDTVDSYMLGGQVVPTFALGETNQVTLGLTFESIVNPEVVAALYFKRDVELDSGYVTNFWDPLAGEFVSDFRVGSLSFEWKNTAIKSWPIKVSVFLYKNFGAGEAEGVILPISSDNGYLAVGRGVDNDTAWFGRVQVGDYKKPGQVAIRFSRYDSKPDAMFFAYSQSDTRRSSDVDGYRVDLRIGMPRKDYVNVTWYNTSWTVGRDSKMNRWQFDYIFRF